MGGERYDDAARIRGGLRGLAAAAIALAAAACSSPPADSRWYKADPGPGELEHVQAYCEITASRRASVNTEKRMQNRVRSFYYNQCMNEAGWTSERVDAE